MKRMRDGTIICFLGEAYVHGMMDGETMKYQNMQKIKASPFELRQGVWDRDWEYIYMVLEFIGGKIREREKQ